MIENGDGILIENNGIFTLRANYITDEPTDIYFYIEFSFKILWGKIIEKNSTYSYFDVNTGKDEILNYNILELE